MNAYYIFMFSNFIVTFRVSIYMISISSGLFIEFSLFCVVLNVLKMLCITYILTQNSQHYLSQVLHMIQERNKPK